ncbi:MAG: serine/threonine protein kinase [Gemmatimonadetes bacterium]|nr:serine/threonine protein kinase [Gemmatimonadota bacterium]
MTTPLPSVPIHAADTGAYQHAFEGQYLLERELGRGGMGIVYLARDVRLDRRVAIKVLPPLLAAKDDIRERFVREARTAAKLSHPSIVPVYRADELRGVAFFVMAYVEGESLGDRIRDRGALPAADVIRWLREVALALGSSHAAGVVHRDVKPENILIERSTSRALMSDFGIARVEASATLTEAGHIMGTAAYMSPEQVNGESLDGRSDLYSLGVVGFHALAGRLPFESPAASALLVAHATKPAPPLASVAPHVPRDVAAVIDRCLRKARDDRFATAEALEEALARAAQVMERATIGANPSGEVVLSESQAAAIWRRAAQLQAEAAARLEQSSSIDATRRTDHPAAADGFRARDVEQAAVEAGISQRFVALALAEVRDAGTGRVAPVEDDSTRDRLVTTLLGTRQRSLSASRIIRHAPREVLQALGRTLQGHPYGLQLQDQVGGHPLDGGVLVFDLPASLVNGTTTGPFTYVRWGVYARQVRATIRPLASDPRATEVTLYVDLRSGLGPNLWGSGAMGVTGGVMGTVLTVAILKKAALVGAVVGGGAGVLALLLGGAGVVGWRAYYKWALRTAQGELDRAIAAIEMSLRSASIFGEAPPSLPPPPSDGGAGSFIASLG